ncbi:MAG: shikimate dehydrogenase [Gemmatimonadetes bacterium]|nr:shikimate dehydrogenase [Gemmatimonadota bacterium]
MSTATHGPPRFAVLGKPIGHSLSPVMQGAALRARGIDATYRAIEVESDQVERTMRELAGSGGGGNVTVPHKGVAAAALDVRTPEVERTGACNTFWSEGGRLHGDNTDIAGFRAALARLLPSGIRGERTLMLGAGGAARAALVALVDDGAREVVVVNRSVDRARRLVDRLGGNVARVGSLGSLHGADFRLLVQATSLGLRADDPLPVSLDDLGAIGGVLDLVYGPSGTALVRAARERGVPALDGREMLVQQGAAAFRRWFGDPVPVDAMRAALAVARP